MRLPTTRTMNSTGNTVPLQPQRSFQRSPNRRVGIAKGFTLIELLLVLAILLVLAGLVVPKLAGRQKAASVDATRISIEGLQQAIEMYAIDHEGDFPSASEGLAVLSESNRKDANWRGPYLNEVPADAWGEGFQYQFPGTRNRDGFDIISAGPDHVFGTEDDIGNWK